MKRRFMRGFLAVLALAGAAGAGAETNEPPPVVIDFFFEPGCPECKIVKDEVMPVLESRFQGFYRIDRHDVSLTSNMVLLVAYQKRLGTQDRNEPVSMVVDYTYPFNGIEAIKRGLPDRVERCVEERLDPAWRAPEPIRVKMEEGMSLAAENAGTFALAAVVAGGLMDGVNPCAMSTLVFFMSLLTIAKVRGRGLLMMGLAFCLASFLVYTALGFGLLRAIHTLDAFPVVRRVLRDGMLAVLGVLAFLSFRDAWRFRRSGKAEDVTLQMPDSLKRRIHGIMRTRLKTSGLLAAGFLIGASVTVIESVCTGQVYIPTLVVVLRSGLGTAREWALLLLYNVMFITPLAGVFGLAYYGLKTEKMLTWSRRHLVPSKILLGLLFVAMMAGLFVL
jgi:hypothetical protein